MRELMYDVNSTLIAGSLFVLMSVVIECGYRLGRRQPPTTNDGFKRHVEIIETSLLGILALLLGFTFSLALQRYDRRSEAVVDEANAIGTTYLRAKLLPASVRDEAKNLLREYLAVRVQTSGVTTVQFAQREALHAEASRLQDRLWTVVERATEEARDPVTALFAESLNETIDAFGRRDAILERHVPEVVLFVLYGTFLLASVMVGYAAGVGQHRASFGTHIMVALIVVLVFIIIDLDRPRRGLIRISQASLVELEQKLAANP